MTDDFRIPFFEASTLTGENIEHFIYESLNEIAKKIDEGYYDIEKNNSDIKCEINLNLNEFENEEPKKYSKKFCIII